MANPELRDEAIRVIRRRKAGRETANRRGPSRRRNNRGSLRAYRIDVRNLTNVSVEVRTFESRTILLIKVHAVRQAETKPASRINLDAGESIDRAVLKRVRRTATGILR